MPSKETFMSTKEELLKLIFFYYDTFTLRVENRHILEFEKDLISEIDFNRLDKFCEDYEILRNGLKSNTEIWENIWDA